MSMMTYEQARAESARVIAEHDAEYGSPAEWAARECSERAFQERKAERARKQQETDRRVAKHQQMLAVRKAERSQPQTLAEFNAANPGWVSWWTERLEAAFDQSARSYNAFVARLDTLSAEEVSAQEQKVQCTPFGALFVLLAQCVGGVHTDIRKEQIEPLRQQMEQRAAVGDAERALLQAALDAKQRQLDELKAKLAQQSEQFERRMVVLEARLSEQQRIADIEANLAARQDAKDAARKGAKGDRGAQGPRGPQGEQGPPGKLTTPPEIVVWEYDIEHYKAAPLLEDGRKGAALNLAPFIQQFIRDTLQRSISNEVEDQLREALKSVAWHDNRW